MPEAPKYRVTFVRLLGFLRPYKWSLAVSIVLAIGSQAAALAADVPRRLGRADPRGRRSPAG